MSAPAPAAIPPPGSCWVSQGYGWVLEFQAGGYTLHHASRLNLLAAEQGTRADFAAAYDIVACDERHLRLHQAGDITAYEFRRIAALPALTRIAAPGALADPVTTFETLWQTFDEHYAFFDLHGTDWQAVAQTQRPRVQAQTSPQELLQVFSDMLLPLQDGHVSLSAGTEGIGCLGAQALRRGLQQTFGTPNLRISPRSTVDAVSRRLDEIVLAPFTQRSPLRQAGNEVLAWCKLTPEVGYLSVLRLFGFADSAAARTANDLPHTRAAVAQFLREDLAALELALDEIFTDLAGCRALVLDLRINGGGFDRAGMAIANRFADRARRAFSKQARAGAGLTPSQHFEVRPGTRPGFGGPVHVLLSPLCVSAGEIFTLCLRPLPQVRVLGLPSAGMLSDNLNKPLPNGWELSLSNEIYTAHDGRVFESCGIAPDVALAALDAEPFVPALHSALQQAVSLLGVP